MEAFTTRVAMGDPQAPFDKVKAIFARYGLLGPDGRLRPHVQLTSMGDHFDWGRAEERVRAGDDGLRLLSWLASHPAEQVQLVLGNHDLGRVGELWSFDDARFEEAFALAYAAYTDDRAGRDEAERRFLERFPEVPSAECVARDLSTFRVAQRDLVTELLRSGRFRLAFAAAPDLLLSHAGVTQDELSARGLSKDEARSAPHAAGALNGALDQAIAAWSGRPLCIPGLHQPGSVAQGEGRGMLYHRPELPELGNPKHFEGPPRRRFDPRRLPPGLTQAIGHTRDKKCQTLLAGWAAGPAAGEGPLRTLTVTGDAGLYRAGTHAGGDSRSAIVLFTDGGMSHSTVDAYELLDLDARRPLA
jgi:hypothetical protein